MAAASAVATSSMLLSAEVLLYTWTASAVWGWKKKPKMSFGGIYRI